MSDEFDELRRLRPDRVEPNDPAIPTVFAREKERLMATINDTPEKSTYELRMPDIYARLAYEDERAALEYLVRVFQFEEIREARTEFEDHILAWVRIGNGVVMLGRANSDIHMIHSPRELGHTTVQLMVRVHDVDAHFAHATEAGADITMPIQDAFYGERRYEATDLEGHRWHFAESHDDVRARGGVVPENPEGGRPS